MKRCNWRYSLIRPLRSRQSFILILILLLGAFFRFYNFPNRISMGLDSARDAFVALVGAKYFQFPLTGPFISIAPVTTGPWYWIQLIVGRLIIPSSFAPWMVIGLYSLLLIIVIYYIGKELGGKRLGLFMAFIAAISSQQADTATQLTNPSVIGFYSSLAVLIYILIIKKGDKTKLGWLFGLVLGINANTHYQTAGLLILPLTLLFFGKKYFKTLTRVLCAFVITFIPLIIFDLNNHWYNVSHMVRYLRFDQYQIYVPMSWTIYMRDYWPSFLSFVFGGSKLVSIIIMLAMVLIFSFDIINGRLKKIFWLLIFSFLTEVVIIRYYRGERFYGYLQFFHPFLFIFLGYVFNRVFSFRYGAIIGMLILILYCASVFPTLWAKLSPGSLNMDTDRVISGIYAKFNAPSYKLYKCKSLIRNEINALTLKLMMDNKYAANGKPLIYKWGCQYPSIRENGQEVTSEMMKNTDNIYPSFELLYDASAASEAAILAAGWVEASPESMYQSAARWWFDEQP